MNAKDLKKEVLAAGDIRHGHFLPLLTEGCFPEEQVLFAIRGSVKKRIVTAAVFALFVLVSLAGMFVFKNKWVSAMGAGALLMAFWPLTDAYERIEVTNMRIKRSKFSKMTAKTEDLPLDRLASCTEVPGESEIELLFVIDDENTFQSVRCLRFDKADENAMRLTQLPCPEREELKRILALNRFGL